jgi:hypothetical protein
MRDVTAKIEVSYDAASLPAKAEGSNVRRTHGETSRRLFGNGYRTRLAEVGCGYETMCEDGKLLCRHDFASVTRSRLGATVWQRPVRYR